MEEAINRRYRTQNGRFPITAGTSNVNLNARSGLIDAP